MLDGAVGFAWNRCFANSRGHECGTGSFTLSHVAVGCLSFLWQVLPSHLAREVLHSAEDVFKSVLLPPCLIPSHHWRGAGSIAQPGPAPVRVQAVVRVVMVGGGSGRNTSVCHGVSNAEP